MSRLVTSNVTTTANSSLPSGASDYGLVSTYYTSSARIKQEYHEKTTSRIWVRTYDTGGGGWSTWAPGGIVLTGDLTVSESAVATISDNSVDGTDIALGSDAAGDIMYYDGTNWIRLPKGSADQVLTMNSGATAPEWQSTSAGGLSASSSVDEANWSGNTYYTKAITVTGASLGDVVSVNLSPSLYSAIRTAGSSLTLDAYVSSANTVTVSVRTSSYITVPGSSSYYVQVH